MHFPVINCDIIEKSISKRALLLVRILEFRLILTPPEFLPVVLID